MKGYGNIYRVTVDTEGLRPVRVDCVIFGHFGCFRTETSLPKYLKPNSFGLMILAENPMFSELHIGIRCFGQKSVSVV